MHIVQRGDSLWKIAQEYGVSLENLKKANELSSDLIREGQVLDIPKD
ncbi:MAG: LysM peptidoglycan-binding domain-containing protein [Verrucomicrobiota bacterium]